MEDKVLVGVEDKMKEQSISETSNVNEVAFYSGKELKFASFENAKKELQMFAQKTTSDFGLDHVPSSGGLFGLGNHKVTGDELNNVTSQVQDYLSKINGVNVDLIKEFGQVYNALESLDKQYIPAILSGIKGAEIASNQAKSAADHAKVAQEDIRKSVQEQKKIIRVLEDHKAKLDKLKHLNSIDEIWHASKKLEQDSNKIKESFEKAKNDLKRLEASLKALQRFADGILDYEHLEDIDDIWERLSVVEDNIEGGIARFKDIEAGIVACNSAIDSMQIFLNQIKDFEHLYEIDEIWCNVEQNQKNIERLEKRTIEQANNLATIQQQAHILNVDDMWEKLNNVSMQVIENKEEIQLEKNALVDWKNSVFEEMNMIAVGDIKRKLVIAYSIAGASMGLVVIELILNILGVL